MRSRVMRRPSTSSMRIVDAVDLDHVARLRAAAERVEGQARERARARVCGSVGARRSR